MERRETPRGDRVRGIIVIISVAAVWSAPSRPAAAEGPAVGDWSRSGLWLAGALEGEAHLLETWVDIDITGVIARTRVKQVFENPGDHWVEGLYAFPLPEEAAVDRLQVWVGGRVLEGEIRERRQARAIYTRARDGGRHGALVEQHRPNVFTISVAQIPPQDRVVVEIELQHTVEYRNNTFALRFPLAITPRYCAAAATPAFVDGRDNADLPVAHGGEALPPPTVLRIRLDAGLPLSHVDSPSHEIEIEELSIGSREIVAVTPGDRDFHLRWQPAPSEEVRTAVFVEPSSEGEAVLMLWMPPTPSDGAEISARERELVFVIDTSGSMAGAAMRDAKQALLIALDMLQSHDFFNVIAFESRTHPLFETSRRAGRRNLERARQFVSDLDANGGTEMALALEAALSSDAGTDLRQIVFLTDGSVGNEQELFEQIERHLGRSRFFPVGIGSAPNAYFLSRAARFGRGSATFIADVDQVAPSMISLFERLSLPALQDLKVEWSGPAEMWPSRLPDLYAGEPLWITAKLPTPESTLRIRGTRSGKPWEEELSLPTATVHRGIAKMWARRKIAALLEAQALGADRARTREQVVEVALAHHLVSRFTSLVAVERTPSRPRSESLMSHAIPLALPFAQGGPSGVAILPAGATSAPHLLARGTLWTLLAVAFAALAHCRRRSRHPDA